MRIVDVCAFYSPQGGGVRTYVEAKLETGPAHGHEIIILAPGPETRTEWHGPKARIEFVRAEPLTVDPRYFYFDNKAVLHAALDRLEPDFVEASSPWRSPSFVAEWNPGIRKALIMHCDPLATYPYRWFGGFMGRDRIDRIFSPFWNHLRRLGEQYDIVVTASENLSQRLREGRVRNVVTNPMGVADSAFSPAMRDPARRHALLLECDLGEDAALLIGIGRHTPMKRWPLVIKAVSKAGTRRPIGLALFGEGHDTSRLQRAIGNNRNIQLFPPIYDREKFAATLASGDLLIHGSDSETFCIAAAEACAAGLPIIAPDAGAIADRADRSCDRLYTAGKVASAAKAILRATGPSLDNRRRLAVASAANTRTMDVHFSELFATYSSLIGGVRRAA